MAMPTTMMNMPMAFIAIFSGKYETASREKIMTMSSGMPPRRQKKNCSLNHLLKNTTIIKLPS
ncbi:hypothetical protein D3C78_1788600 [compost metagenome]